MTGSGSLFHRLTIRCVKKYFRTFFSARDFSSFKPVLQPAVRAVARTGPGAFNQFSDRSSPAEPVAFQSFTYGTRTCPERPPCVHLRTTCDSMIVERPQQKMCIHIFSCGARTGSLRAETYDGRNVTNATQEINPT